jgi:hypothetical protein
MTARDVRRQERTRKAQNINDDIAATLLSVVS